MRVRPAGDVDLRLEGRDKDWNLRRANLHQMHDVAGDGQRPVPNARAGVQTMAGAALMLNAGSLPMVAFIWLVCSMLAGWAWAVTIRRWQRITPAAAARLTRTFLGRNF